MKTAEEMEFNNPIMEKAFQKSMDEIGYWLLESEEDIRSLFEKAWNNALSQQPLSGEGVQQKAKDFLKEKHLYWAFEREGRLEMVVNMLTEFASLTPNKGLAAEEVAKIFNRAYLTAIINAIRVLGANHNQREIFMCNSLTESEVLSLGMCESDIETLRENWKSLTLKKWRQPKPSAPQEQKGGQE